MGAVKSNKLNDVYNDVAYPVVQVKELSLFWWSVPPLSEHTNGSTKYLNHCVESNLVLF